MPKGFRKTEQVAPRQDTLVAHFRNYLHRHLAGFKKLAPVEQRRVATWIWHSDSKRRAHSEHQGYMSISYLEIKQFMGRERFKQINADLGLFDEIKERRFHEKRKGYTRAYLLSDKAKALKQRYHNTAKIWLSDLLDVTHGERIKTPSRALAARNAKGREPVLWRKFKDQLPQKVRVDVDTLRRYLRLAQEAQRDEQFRAFFNTPKYERAASIGEHLSKLIRMANTTAAGRGYVLTRYMEIESGRLYADGADSLQTVPRNVRKAALHGWWDVDFENCHYSLFEQIAERLGVRCIAIADYLAHKRPTRARIGKEVGINEDAAKLCLIAMIYGASRGIEWWEGEEKRQGAIAKQIGQDKARLFLAHPVVEALFTDIQQGRKAILAGWSNRRGQSLLNDAGKAIRVDKATPAQQLAHLLQGAEALMLTVAYQLHAGSIVLLQHDGFTSTKPVDDLRRLEMEIHAKTGYRIGLVQERLQIPADLDFGKV